MPLNTKSFTDFFRLIQGKFLKEIPGIDPTIKASLVRATTGSVAAAAISNQEGLVDAVNQSFWQTADDDFLELIGNYDGAFRFTAQAASGFGAAPGTLAEVVPSGTSITFGGNSYLTTQDSSVQKFSGDITLSYSAGIVTAVTTLAHTLSSGLSVDISDVVQTDYNGTFDIIVLDENTFTYELDAGVLTADSGSYSSEYALLTIESISTGAIQNVAAGGIMKTAVLDKVIYVGTDGISGGLDIEEIEDYRIRVGENHSLTPGIATAPSLKSSVKSIAGNTRVFVVRPDGTSGGTPGEAGYKPEIGETVIYFLRDNDISILPSSAKITETKNKILSDGLWPSFIQDDFLYVLAPILTTQDFNFNTISPNTVTMQNAIIAQLPSFFEDNSEIEGIITLDVLDSFLRQIQDPSTGQFLTSFTYDNPTTDIVAGSGEIYTLGDVSFV